MLYANIRFNIAFLFPFEMIRVDPIGMVNPLKYIITNILILYCQNHN